MNAGLLVVDVQPAYAEWCSQVAKKVATRINNTRKPTVIMWVGDGLTYDREEDVIAYLHHHGARPGKLSTCMFVEKDYGFYRPWMDAGVDSTTIVQVGQEMVNQRVFDSRDLDLSEWLDDDASVMDPIRQPGFDSSALNFIDKFDVCGGGSEQCLAEIELWLDIHRKPYQRLDALVY